MINEDRLIGMSNNSNIHDNKDLEDWLDSLSASERQAYEKVWKEAEPSHTISVSDEEKQQALQSIKRRIRKEDNRSSQESSTSASAPVIPFASLSWKSMAAAALVLIAIGLSYLLIPVERTAPMGEQLTVTMNEGTTITLNSGSTLSYNRMYGYTNRDVSLHGEAFFDVESREQSFTVETRNAIVTVLGTSFNVRAWTVRSSPETTVALKSGSLALSSAENPSQKVVLSPGQQSSVTIASDVPTEPQDVSIDRVTSWLDNRFAFEERTLIEIIGELERRFDIDVNVQPTEILDDTLTVYYSSRVSAEQIIQDICVSKGLSYRAKNGGFVIESK